MRRARNRRPCLLSLWVSEVGHFSFMTDRRGLVTISSFVASRSSCSRGLRLIEDCRRVLSGHWHFQSLAKHNLVRCVQTCWETLENTSHPTFGNHFKASLSAQLHYASTRVNFDTRRLFLLLIDHRVAKSEHWITMPNSWYHRCGGLRFLGFCERCNNNNHNYIPERCLQFRASPPWRMDREHACFSHGARPGPLAATRHER